MAKPQKGKQTSKIPMPMFFRLFDTIYQLQAGWSYCRVKLRMLTRFVQTTASSFAFAVRALTNSEEQSLRRMIRQERRKEELKAIGRRLLRS